jgi:hypothetical protein
LIIVLVDSSARTAAASPPGLHALVVALRQREAR